MAIYQFYLAVIPKSGLLKKYAQLPTQIHVSTEKGYFESNTELYWEVAAIESHKIIQEVDQLLDRAHWGNNRNCIIWKVETDIGDNDASMEVEESSGRVVNFTFRADLREEDLVFLRSMIDLGRRYDWLFMDCRGQLVRPDFEEMKSLILASNAYRFLTNPRKFLRELEEE